MILIRPPENIIYGIQKGAGTKYETDQKKLSSGDELIFEFAVDLRKDTLGKTKLSGPFVQGTAGNKFLYLDIGRYAGQQNTEWARRLKIPLRGIAESIDPDSSHSVFEIRIEGTDHDGGPSCGTMKPYNGWKRLS